RHPGVRGGGFRRGSGAAPGAFPGGVRSGSGLRCGVLVGPGVRGGVVSGLGLRRGVLGDRGFRLGVRGWGGVLRRVLDAGAPRAVREADVVDVAPPAAPGHRSVVPDPGLSFHLRALTGWVLRGGSRGRSATRQAYSAVRAVTTALNGVLPRLLVLG